VPPLNPSRRTGFDDDWGPSPIDLENAFLAEDDLPDEDELDPVEVAPVDEPEEPEPAEELTAEDEIELAPTDEEADDPAALDPSSAVAAIRADAAVVEASIAGLHDAVSRTALAAYADPGNADLRREADQALASLRDASDRLQQLTAAAGLAERQAAEQAAALRLAEHQKARDKVVARWEKAIAKAKAAGLKRQDEEQKLPDAKAALDDAQRQLNNAQIRVDVIEERIASFQSREDAAWNEAAAAEQTLHEFDNPVIPPTAADELARIAAEHAARIAAMEAETDRQLREAYDNEIVPVEPTRVPHAGGDGWRYEGGKVVAVPRRDLDRLADEKARAEEQDAARYRAAQEEAQHPARNPRPWRSLQGPPTFFGLEVAMKAWASRALPDDIEFALAAARDRGDSYAVDFLSGRV
jgi:hypothetical protein